VRGAAEYFGGRGGLLKATREKGEPRNIRNTRNVAGTAATRAPVESVRSCGPLKPKILYSMAVGVGCWVHGGKNPLQCYKRHKQGGWWFYRYKRHYLLLPEPLQGLTAEQDIGDLNAKIRESPRKLYEELLEFRTAHESRPFSSANPWVCPHEITLKQ